MLLISLQDKIWQECTRLARVPKYAENPMSMGVFTETEVSTLRWIRAELRNGVSISELLDSDRLQGLLNESDGTLWPSQADKPLLVSRQKERSH